MKRLALPLLFVVVLAGCAKINDTSMRILATPASAVAVVGDTLMSGRALLYVDRTGTLSLGSSDGSIQCSGTMRYTATHTGVANLRCSNGDEIGMGFVAVREAIGHGNGQDSQGRQASFTYGLALQDALGFLRPPAGRRLGVVLDAEGEERIDWLP